MRSKGSTLLASLLAISYGFASETVFSVNDDVLAYPQFKITFSESYLSETDANLRLRNSKTEGDNQSPAEDTGSELSSLSNQDDPSTSHGASAKAQFRNESYERMLLNGRPYLCTIPNVELPSKNTTKESIPEADQEKELTRAAGRGWELLQDMEGKPCLFFSTGWWSYSFCYNSQIKQFHSLPPGANGAPIYPPTEDSTTPSYVLGKFEQRQAGGKAKTSSGKISNEVAELQTKAEARYLVQRLSGGTTCDLTGKDRKVEVQFHCHPQSTDRIGWIKETATCTYLMVVYTPRLCNDVAFLPPREVKANPVSCQEILKPDDVLAWEARRAAEVTRKLIDQGANQRLMAGDIEIGGMKEVGREGKRIEKGKVVSTPEERAETVAIQKDGKIQGLSKAELRKRNINPEAVEAFRKDLQQRAGSKDWRIEIWDENNGHMELRGIIAADEESEESGGKESKTGDKEEGSEEEFKEDL